MRIKIIKIGTKRIQALEMSLQNKKLIVARGNRGYIMCGYLNLKTANKFKDVAIKVVGVSSIEELLKAHVAQASNEAKKHGIYAKQPVQKILAIIA